MYNLQYVVDYHEMLLYTLTSDQFTNLWTWCSDGDTCGFYVKYLNHCLHQVKFQTFLYATFYVNTVCESIGYRLTSLKPIVPLNRHILLLFLFNLNPIDAFWMCRQEGVTVRFSVKVWAENWSRLSAQHKERYKEKKTKVWQTNWWTSMKSFGGLWITKLFRLVEGWFMLF